MEGWKGYGNRKNETKREKFKLDLERHFRIVEDRVNRIMHLFQLLRNTTSANYDVAPEDVEKVIAQVDKVWKETKVFMRRKKTRTRDVFEFDNH